MNQDQNQRLEALLETVSKPVRYTGGEVNQIKKDWENHLRFCFAFPDTYEVAMSHLGMKVIYEAVNQKDDLLCERVCMPWTDMMDGLVAQNIPLFSLESRAALSDFDCLGFTLQYEMSYTNILKMLELGGIALLSLERQEDAPFVIAGGPCAMSPEPLAPFIDAFLMGDGEVAAVQMLRTIQAGRAGGKNREAILLDLAKLEGVYVPRFYEASYHEDGRLKGILPTVPGLPKVIKKRIELDLDITVYPGSTPLPYLQAVHDRAVLEVMRGCSRGCRFCQAGMLYRPVRERSPETLFKLAEQLVASTGYEELGLSSLSTGDYSRLNELILGLNERFKDQGISLSLPSLRVDGQLQQALKDSSAVRKSGLTLAPEAGTQRLRDVINKGVTEEDLLRTAREAFMEGWSNIKLYFMIGLPTETDEDLLGIADLARKVVAEYHNIPKGQRARGLKVTVSASTFVPKPFTPFQWAAQDTLEEIKRKQALLRNALNIRGVQFNWHDPEVSQMEACFSRGDRRMAEVLLKAYQKGCLLDGWSEHYKHEAWLSAFEEAGLDPAFYANREREKGELLPWDIVDIGVTKAYLWLENERSKTATTTPDCRGFCEGCGLRRFEGVCPV